MQSYKLVSLNPQDPPISIRVTTAVMNPMTNNMGRKGFNFHSWSSSEKSRQEDKQGRNLEVGTEGTRGTACLLSEPWRGGSHLPGLGSPPSVTSEENAPQAGPQPCLTQAFSQLRLPLRL